MLHHLPKVLVIALVVGAALIDPVRQASDADFELGGHVWADHREQFAVVVLHALVQRRGDFVGSEVFFLSWSRVQRRSNREGGSVPWAITCVNKAVTRSG